jgi:hypothetical protein
MSTFLVTTAPAAALRALPIVDDVRGHLGLHVPDTDDVVGSGHKIVGTTQAVGKTAVRGNSLLGIEPMTLRAVEVHCIHLSYLLLYTLDSFFRVSRTFHSLV